MSLGFAAGECCLGWSFLGGFLGGWSCLTASFIIFLQAYFGQMEKKCQIAVLSLLSVSRAVMLRIGEHCVPTFAKESSTEHMLPPSSS